MRNHYNCWRQYHGDNKYIFIAVHDHMCVIYMFLKHSAKIGCNLHGHKNKYHVLALLVLAKWFEVGYISYCSSYCMSIGMSGPAWHICSRKYIICPSTEYLPNLSIAAKAFLNPYFNNQLGCGTISLSEKCPVHPTCQYASSGPSLHSCALGEVI